MSDTVDLKSAVKNKDTTIFSREQKFLNRYNMYHDDYREQVKNRLVEIYQGAVELRLDRQMDLTNNIFKNIVDKISRVYSFGVNREINNDAFQEYLESSDYEKTMKQANRYLNGLNDILLQVSWNSKTKEPKFIFRLPHKTRVKLDDDEVIEVEYFIQRDEDGNEKWAFWSDTEHYYKIYSKGSDDFTKEYPKGNEAGINPFNELPFLIMQKGFRDGEFWDINKGDDLVEMTLDNSIYKTFKNYMIKWQSFKQVVVTGNNIGAISGQILDPQKALTIEGEGASLSVLDLQANIKELDETLDNNSNNVAINYNISPNQFRMTGAVSSGYALKMENKSLDEFTTEQQKDFVKYEKRAISLIAKAFEIFANIKYPSDVVVEFNEPYYAESKTEQLASYEKEIELGLNNPIQILQNTKDIDENEAKKMYSENVEIRNQMQTKLNQGNLNLETTQTALEEANK